MVHSTLTRNVLRELLADTIRSTPGAAPGDLADQILETLHTYAPKAYVNERLDLEADDKLVEIAKSMIQTAAFDVEEWQIRHAFPRLSEQEAQAVNDLIGMASVTVEI